MYWRGCITGKPMLHRMQVAREAALPCRCSTFLDRLSMFLIHVDGVSWLRGPSSKRPLEAAAAEGTKASEAGNLQHRHRIPSLPFPIPVLPCSSLPSFQGSPTARRWGPQPGQASPGWLVAAEVQKCRRSPRRARILQELIFVKLEFSLSSES